MLFVDITRLFIEDNACFCRISTEAEHYRLISLRTIWIFHSTPRDVGLTNAAASPKDTWGIWRQIRFWQGFSRADRSLCFVFQEESANASAAVKREYDVLIAGLAEGRLYTVSPAHGADIFTDKNAGWPGQTPDSHHLDWLGAVLFWYSAQALNPITRRLPWASLDAFK